MFIGLIYLVYWLLYCSEDGEGDWLKFFSAKEKEKAVKTNEKLRNQRSKSCIPAEGEGLGGKSHTEEVKSDGPGGRKVKFEEDKYEMIADSQMAETQKVSIDQIKCKII